VDDSALEVLAGARRARFANAATRAALARILDDLTHRIEDRRIASEDAAAIVARLADLCRDPERVSRPCDQQELRAVLDPERFTERTRELAAAYALLATS